MTDVASPVEVDAATFEILRHRLWAINDEAASAIARISGSPVASEAYDFNTALLTATGGVVMIGAYVMAHAAALDRVVEYVRREHHDNPGIGPGDMYLTNDPYVGAMHQPDVVVVAPIFVGDELVAWCGSIVHQTDVGGPVAGSVTAGARSIYEEAIPMSPVRLVEAGVVRKDLEREYLIRSRMPELNALDLRGQIAANHVQTTRFVALCEEHGTDVVLAVVNRLVASTEQRFRERLASLPDGVWRHVGYIEHDGIDDAVYPIVLTMTKVGNALDLDFTESADQAPALINCTAGTLRGYALSAVLTLLAHDIPWVPAGLWPAITVRARPGSIVDAEWPAGVSMGNSSSGLCVRTAVNVCISSMLGEAGSDRALASCIGSFAGQNIAGHWASGERFGTMLLDSVSGGGGASAAADGLDSAGMMNAPASAISNVETNELNYPMLYLWRRQLVDSGGPGRFRGGLGGEHAYVVHGADGGFDSTLFAHGIEQPTSAGVAGGEPGAPHEVLLVRDGRDVTVRSLADLDADRIDAPPPKSRAGIGADDLLVHRYAGGGGYGDPLDRPLAEVAADVVRGRVSTDRARTDYAVVVDESGVIDHEQSEELRHWARATRAEGEPADASAIPCAGCGATGRVTADEAVTTRWPATARHDGADRFVHRRTACSSCGSQLGSEVRLRDAAP